MTSVEILRDFYVKVSPSNRVQLSVVPLSPPRPSPDSKIIYLPVATSIYIEKDDFTIQGGSLASHPNCKIDSVPSSGSSDLPILPRAKQFSRKARLTLLDAAGALEKEGYPPGDFYFFTGTLPGSTEKSKEMLARYSRYALNLLKQFLRDRGLNLTFNCWEWQKRGALHLHLVVLCPNKQLGSSLPTALQNQWFKILESISEKSRVNLWERAAGGSHHRKSKAVLENCCKTIRCEKSPAAYLSKYVGKGSAAPDKKLVSRIKNVYYPSSWWSISKPLRALIHKYSASFSIRLPVDSAMENFNKILEVLKGVSSLVLNPFRPHGYSDYLYCNVYVLPDLYTEVSSGLADVFSALSPESRDSGEAIVYPLGHPLSLIPFPRQPWEVDSA